MLLDLIPDQEFLRETTAKFLDDQVPAQLLQQMATAIPADWEASYWRRGAELGWTSLLVSEEAGGGSVSGQGLADLCVIAHEFGRHAAPGPLVPANVVAAALSDAGTHREVLEELLGGTAVAAWIQGPADIRASGTGLVLNGVARPVEAASQARYLLVTGSAVPRSAASRAPRQPALRAGPRSAPSIAERTAIVPLDLPARSSSRTADHIVYFMAISTRVLAARMRSRTALSPCPTTVPAPAAGRRSCRDTPGSPAPSTNATRRHVAPRSPCAWPSVRAAACRGSASHQAHCANVRPRTH